MDIYVVTMSNDEMEEMEIGYASSKEKAQKMIDTVSNTDGFEMNEYRYYKSTLDYLEINDEPIKF